MKFDNSFILQTSVESGSIFSFLHQVFAKQSVEDLKKQAGHIGLTDDEFQVSKYLDIIH